MSADPRDGDLGGPGVRRLDLTGVPCPQNTARALFELECVQEGRILEILLDDGEPIQNVPPSPDLEGHTVLERVRSGTQWILRVRPGEE